MDRFGSAVIAVATSLVLVGRCSNRRRRAEREPDFTGRTSRIEVARARMRRTRLSRRDRYRPDTRRIRKSSSREVRANDRAHEQSLVCPSALQRWTPAKPPGAPSSTPTWMACGTCSLAFARQLADRSRATIVNYEVHLSDGRQPATVAGAPSGFESCSAPTH
jgi:hypothetical protein